MATSDKMTPWRAPEGVLIPANVDSADTVVSFALALNKREQDKIKNAFSGESYDMAAEYVWRRCITALRSTLAGLGMKFVGEMLDRPDIDELSTPEQALTDYDTIRLAGSLGILNATGELKLRQAFQTIVHFASKDAQEELSKIDALQILRACTQYVLAQSDMQVAVDFSRFRRRIMTESLTLADPHVQQLIGSPPFFLRTTLRVLIASIKSESGATLDHALENLGLILPEIWLGLADEDRWSVGKSYAEVAAAGNSRAVNGLKRVLTKVSGFDYVPESLRSETYRRAAQAVIDAHYGWENFHEEPVPTEKLASLGTTIPMPAFPICMRAFLVVYLGNPYGVSRKAAPIAEQQLLKLPTERWALFLEKLLHADDRILEKLTYDRPVAQFIDLVAAAKLVTQVTDTFACANLVRSAAKSDAMRVKKEAERLASKLRGV